MLVTAAEGGIKPMQLGHNDVEQNTNSFIFSWLDK
jgi:hypothetical protein